MFTMLRIKEAIARLLHDAWSVDLHTIFEVQKLWCAVLGLKRGMRDEHVGSPAAASKTRFV